MTTKYTIFIRKSALRELSKIRGPSLHRIRRAIDALGNNPRPIGCRKLRGGEGTYCIRVGDYRVVYEVDDGTVFVVIVRVRHRRDVYR